MSFKISNKSLFDMKTHAIVNSINCVGAMGAGIALEFKKRFPEMFQDYYVKCLSNKIRPGDCDVYHYKDRNLFILNVAVKNDWKQWSTLEWLNGSIKSMKLAILENDIKSVSLPVIGGMNGRRGPLGKVPGMTPPPTCDEIKKLIQKELEPFSNKFGIDIFLCIPEQKAEKPQRTLARFLENE